MTIKGQAPERGQSGKILTRSSTPGSSIGFSRQTVGASTSFAIAAGATSNLTATTVVYELGIPTTLLTNQNIKSWDDTVVWQFFNIFVDNDNDFNYKIGNGSSLSADQKLVTIQTQIDAITPITNTSSTVNFQFKNGGSSSHTLYVYVKSKYIIIG